MFEKFARGTGGGWHFSRRAMDGRRGRTVMAPEPDAGAEGSGAPMRMLDARVNAKDAWQRSIAARHWRGSGTAGGAAVARPASLRRSLTSDASTPGLSIKGVRRYRGAFVDRQYRRALTTAVAGKATENVVR